MVTTGWVACPDRYRHEADAGRLAAASGHGWDPSRAAGAAAALLAEGHCPACPQVRLDPGDLVLYGEARQVGRCACCGAAWVLGPDGTYLVLGRGRLVEGGP